MITPLNGKKDAGKELPDRIKHNFEELGVLINLPENWDGQGSIPINEKTLHQTKAVMEDLLDIMSHFKMPIPDIGAVPDGSIDIYFKTDFYKIIINIPSELNDYFELYGKTKGSILPQLDTMTKNPESIVYVIREWLKNNPLKWRDEN